jgi:DNA-binding transcriptional MocR family regulator
MANSKPYKSRKRGQPQYVMLYHWIADTDAWRTMKPAPRALYLEIKRKYNGHNNGAVLLSYRDASKRLNVSYNSVGKWFRELEKRGFIVCMQRHHLGPSGVGQTSHWRLTEYEYERRPPTADFKNWRPD